MSECMHIWMTDSVDLRWCMTTGEPFVIIDTECARCHLYRRQILLVDRKQTHDWRHDSCCGEELR